MDALVLTVILTSVPLILAATGELVAEKTGVLNLGVEGMMLMGVAAFAVPAYLGTLSRHYISCARWWCTAGVFAVFALG